MVKEIENPPAVQGEEVLPDQPRTLEQLTAEINYIRFQTAQGAIEIGIRLKEAKAQLSHGQWEHWLQEQVNFSPRTARNLIRIADNFAHANRQALAGLSYTKMVALTILPREGQEQFLLDSHDVDGEQKTVYEMSSREVEKVIREKKAAEKEAQKAKAELKEERALRAQAQNKSAALSAQLEEAKRQASAASLPAGEAEKALDREVGGLRAHLQGSAPVLLDCIKSTGTQTMVDTVVALSEDLDQMAKEIKSAAICSRNNSFLREPEEDLDWLDD